MGNLPNATVIMETTRKLHEEFVANPIVFWRKYEKWLRPMNSLVPGHFFSICENADEFKFVEYYGKSCLLELEYTDLGRNYAKVMFNTEAAHPYKVPSG